MKNIAWICSLIVASTACEASHQLGSDCPDDVCPRALGRAEPACLVRESRWIVQIDYGEGEVPEPAREFAIFVKDEDFGTRRVYWKFGEPRDACDEPYLESPDADDEAAKQLRRDQVAEDNPRPLVCVVKQATRNSEGGFESEGWYYGDEESSRFGTRRPIRYSPGVGAPPNKVTIYMTRAGAELITRDGTLKQTDPGVCSLPEDSAAHESDVGRSCSLTASREGGYDESEVVVETGSTQCATGACLVYRLAGDPNKACGKDSDPACHTGSVVVASKEEIQKRVYCSCRCDAPDGDPGELCTCESGFSCVPALRDAPPGIRGSYCVKNGTFSTPAL